MEGAVLGEQSPGVTDDERKGDFVPSRLIIALQSSC
jgi:hypothetical protein